MRTQVFVPVCRFFKAQYDKPPFVEQFDGVPIGRDIDDRHLGQFAVRYGVYAVDPLVIENRQADRRRAQKAAVYTLFNLFSERVIFVEYGVGNQLRTLGPDVVPAAYNAFFPCVHVEHHGILFKTFRADALCLNNKAVRIDAFVGDDKCVCHVKVFG